MRRWSIHSLRVRVLLLVTMALVPAMALAVNTGLARRRADGDAARRDAMQVSELVAFKQDQLIDDARRVLEELAAWPEVRAGDPAVCSARLAALLARSPHYLNFGVSRCSDAMIIASALPITGPVPAGDRPWYRAVLRTKTFAAGEYQIGRITGKPSINFGYPLFGPDGGIVRIVFAAVDLAWLNELVADARLPQGSIATIIDREGTVVARSADPGAWIGKKPTHPAFRAALASTTAGAVDGAGLDGEPRLFAFRPLTLGSDQIAGRLLIGIPATLAYGPADRQLRLQLVALGLVALLSFSLALIAGYFSVGRPVAALTTAAQRLAAGDLAARTGLSQTGGEIGALARAFDRMAEGLDARGRETATASLALRNSEARFRAFMENSPAYAFIKDTQGRVVYITRRFEEQTGVKAEEFVGHPVEETLSPETAAAGLAHDRRVLAEGRASQMVQRVTFPNGTTQDLLVMKFPLPDGDGQTLIGGFAIDISDRLRAEEEVRRLNADLEQRVADRTAELLEANADLEQFARTVSHDLRAPLRAVQGFTQALLEDHAPQLDATGKDYAQRAAAAAQRMDSLIQDLLAYSRISRTEFEIAPVSLDVVITDARAQVDAFLTEQKATVNITHALPRVNAHRGTLVQVVVNLLTNAVKFVDGVAPAVRLRTEERNGHIRLWIEDNGIGIAPEHCERIFRPFERLHGADRFPGTGIGLAIVRRGVERMGGQVGVESEPGHGSRFWVDLPKASVN